MLEKVVKKTLIDRRKESSLENKNKNEMKGDARGKFLLGKKSNALKLAARFTKFEPISLKLLHFLQ